MTVGKKSKTLTKNMKISGAKKPSGSTKKHSRVNKGPVKARTKPKGILKKEIHAKESKHPVKDDEEDSSGDHLNAQHSSLLKGIQSLDGKKAPINQRNESAKQSEYHTKGTKKVNFGDLLKPLGSADANVKKHLQKQDGSRKLPEPIEKIHVKKAERVVKYEVAKDELQKWEGIVEENRVTPQQQFPLQRSHISIPSARKEAAGQEPRTMMELEIQALLRGEEFVPEEAMQTGNTVLSKAEQLTEKWMKLATAREELALRRKHRKMVADVAARNRRQGKIKSRSYHRHLKNERRKNAYKELEKLKSEDPALWKEKAEEVERARVEERATLRHKGKSKFAKLAKRYGKFNEKIKDSLDEMRSKGVELLKKQVESDTSSEEESEGEERADVDMNDLDSDSDGEMELHSRNPWSTQKLKKSTPSVTKAEAAETSSDEEDMPEAAIDYRESDKVVVIEPDMAGTQSDVLQMAGIEEALEAAEEISRDADDLMAGQTTRRMKTRSEVDKFDDQFEGDGRVTECNVSSEDVEMAAADASQEIDANKVIAIPSTNLAKLSRSATGSSDDEDEELGQSLAQAFADDGIAEEFAARRKRKFDEEDEAADAEAALKKLPGWGRWSGAGIEDKPKSKRKMTRWEKERLRKEELRKAAAETKKEVKRSKYPKGVIVNEEALRSQPIAKYQVSKMKHNMSGPTFNALMSHPVGRDFIPAVAHNELCKPRVVTGVGSIIAPMSKEMVTEKNKHKFPSSTSNDGEKVAKQYQLQPMRKQRKNKTHQLAKQLVKR